MDRLGVAVKDVLRRRGWRLRRLAGGFAVARQAGDFCELSPERAEALAPSRLKRRLLAPVTLSPEEEAGLEELRAALGLWLEARGGAGRAAARDSSAEAHEGREGEDLLLRTTFACNQRCPFCFIALTGRRAGLPELEERLRDLAARAGPRAELTLSGGEPASDPRLTRIVAAARDAGLRRFVLQTNGVYLARPGLVEALSALGVRSYLFSLHADGPALYDKMTGSRGQFPRAWAGLKALLARPEVDVTVNVVVTVWNYRRLEALAERLARLAGKRRLELYFSMLNEAGHQKVPAWAVDLADAAPFLRAAARSCRRHGLSVARSGAESSFPACLFDAPARHASRRALPQDRVVYAEDFRAGVPVGRAKRPPCRSCPYDARCPGVPAAYAARFGLGALGRNVASH